jgi:hypothetical protein
MTQDLANVSTALLRQRVNKRLRVTHSLSYISRVKHGKAGSPSLRDVVNQEVAKILSEAFEAVQPADTAAP